MRYKYFRVHTNDIAFHTKEPRGIFTSIWKLVEGKILSESEIAEYWENRKYFESILPIPTFYGDGNSVKAITWYKNNDEGNWIFNQMSFYLNMAKKYDLELYKSMAVDLPGNIIYEDLYQIGVVRDEKSVHKLKIEKLT